MSGKKPTHEALLVYDDGKDEQGKPIARFAKICALRESDKGNLMINIPKGMLLTGKILIKPITEKKESLSDVGNVDDDLPFN